MELFHRGSSFDDRTCPVPGAGPWPGSWPPCAAGRDRLGLAPEHTAFDAQAGGPGPWRWRCAFPG
jgi:hypothetical protein